MTYCYELLQQHKELGISEQIDYQKHYLDSLINNSVALSDLSPEPIDSEMVDKHALKQEMVDNRRDRCDLFSNRL